MNYPIILARNLTKNPQNRGFCALFAFGTPIFGLFEHKIGIFVRFGGAMAGSNGGDDLEQREQREQREQL